MCSIFLFEPSEPLQALISHDLSPLKYDKFKIQAQENNEVCLFEEMTNVSAPSEQKPPLDAISVPNQKKSYKRCKSTPVK